MTDLLLPTYTNLLTSLSAWLTKAGEHHADTGALMSARLAPDMFPLATQIRFVCVQAYEGVGRLRGEAFPPVWLALLEEGRNAASAPGTLADAQARLRDTLSYLASLPPGVLDGKGHLAVAHELPNGMVFDMTGDQYVRDWALPALFPRDDSLRHPASSRRPARQGRLCPIRPRLPAPGHDARRPGLI